MDNFLCTNDMSLHTIGHTSEGPLATLRWYTRHHDAPERTILSEGRPTRAAGRREASRSGRSAAAARGLRLLFEKDGPLDPTTPADHVASARIT